MARPYRLTIVCHGYPPGLGGAEELVRRIAECVAAAPGWQVTVLTTDTLDAGGFVEEGPRIGVPREERNGVLVRRFPVVRLPRGEGLPGRGRAEQSEWLQALRLGPVTPALWCALVGAATDVYLGAAFPYLTMRAALYAGCLRRRPVVLLGCYHIDDTVCFNRRWQDRAIAAAALYLANSPAEEAYLAARVPGANLATIVPGIRHRADAARQAPGRPLHLLHVGHLQERKRVHEMVTFVGRVNRACVPSPAMRLTLVYPQGGPYLEDIRALLAADAQLAAAVTLRERISDDELAGAYMAADYYVTFAEHESFGLAAHEALGYAVPVLHDGRSTQLAALLGAGAVQIDPSGDPRALYAHLTDTERYRRLSAAALQSAGGERSWAAAAEQYLRALTGLVRR